MIVRVDCILPLDRVIQLVVIPPRSYADGYTDSSTTQSTSPVPLHVITVNVAADP
jgi:hypothetical protein